jgi:multicomponent Na+:H+ antiporter subunit F
VAYTGPTAPCGAETTVMEAFYTGMALFLLANVAAGLVRVSIGPQPADRMLTAQLLGSSGVAIFLLLAEALQQPPLRNVALLFALLAVLAVVAFVERPAEEDEDEP